MTTRVRGSGLSAVMCATIVTVSVQGISAPGGDDTKACGLLSASEIESILCTEVTLNGSASMPRGTTQICRGQALNARIMCWS